MRNRQGLFCCFLHCCTTTSSVIRGMRDRGCNFFFGNFRLSQILQVAERSNSSMRSGSRICALGSKIGTQGKGITSIKDPEWIRTKKQRQGREGASLCLGEGGGGTLPTTRGGGRHPHQGSRGGGGKPGSSSPARPTLSPAFPVWCSKDDKYMKYKYRNTDRQ